MNEQEKDKRSPAPKEEAARGPKTVKQSPRERQSDELDEQKLDEVLRDCPL